MSSAVSAAPAASTPQAAPLAYAPLPPRPTPPPERPWWRTGKGWLGAAGWVVVLAGCFFIGRGIYRQYQGADRRATEAAEVKQEKEHARRVFVWVQDTLATTLVEGSVGRPVPTTDAAKRIWTISRMLVDRWTWERDVLARHGVTDKAYKPPAALGTVRYQANARAYPEVGRYLESRAAAIAEIEAAWPRWVAERMAALERESGLPSAEVRNLFPAGFGSTAADQARHVNALLEIHRHLVRVDPRVSPGGGDMLLYDREEEGHRSQALARDVYAAAADYARARQQRLLRERSAFSPLLQ